jgi:Pathogenicity locus
MSETPIIIIPGIGKTFTKDFARIGLFFVEDFETKIAEQVYQALYAVNEKQNRSTSRNYLYLIRMIIYYAKGGREVAKLKWNYWQE